MRRIAITFAIALLGSVVPTCLAQRHSFGTSPPTAPPLRMPASSAPVAAVSSGMGAIQFQAANVGVPAPQALTRQLQADDERTRASALSSIGAPSQYTQHGHTAEPHSVGLELAQLSDSEDLDAVLTAELDNHIVSAVLVQDDNGWRRVATLIYSTPFDDPRATPATFLHLGRSLVQRDRYRAVFRASTFGPNGDFTENEAVLRVINNRAVVTMSFVDAARECTVVQNGVKASVSQCSVTQRWLQGDPADASHRFLLVTATGRVSGRDASSVLTDSRNFAFAHLRSFSCQPFLYSETAQRFEAVAPSKACPNVP